MTTTFPLLSNAENAKSISSFSMTWKRRTFLEGDALGEVAYAPGDIWGVLAPEDEEEDAWDEVAFAPDDFWGVLAPDDEEAADILHKNDDFSKKNESPSVGRNSFGAYFSAVDWVVRDCLY